MTLDSILTISKNDDDTFVAHNHTENPNGFLFGGQILAQSLLSVVNTMETKNRHLHSLHAYFVSPGSAATDVHYSVNSIKNGKSFSLNNVCAIQNNRTIFNASISSHDKESRIAIAHEDKIDLLNIPSNADIQKMYQRYELMKNDDKLSYIAKIYNLYRQGLFDVVTTKKHPYMFDTNGKMQAELWIKSHHKINIKDVAKHQATLLYISDMVLFTAVIPHKVNIENINIASINHAVWLHQPIVNMNKWHFIKIKSHWANNGRALVNASIYNQDQSIVASVMQEGVVRLK